MWIKSDDCDKGSLKDECKGATGQVYYSYYDGSISGPVMKTTVWFDKVKSVDNYILVAKTRTSLMDNRIVGLSHTHSEYPNFMGSLKKNGIIDEIAFSLFYNPLSVIFFLHF